MVTFQIRLCLGVSVSQACGSTRFSFAVSMSGICNGGSFSSESRSVSLKHRAASSCGLIARPFARGYQQEIGCTVKPSNDARTCAREAAAPLAKSLRPALRKLAARSSSRGILYTIIGAAPYERDH